VCVNCGLDFRTGRKVQKSEELVNVAGSDAKTGFWGDTLVYILGIPLTGKKVVGLGLGMIALVVLILVFFTRNSVGLLEIRPVEVFTALDGINPYLIYLRTSDEQSAQLGFPFMHVERSGGKTTYYKDQEPTKRLVFIRENAEGTYITFRLALSQKYLVSQAAADSARLHLKPEDITLQAGKETWLPVFLDFEYKGPTVNAEIISARKLDQFVPPGFPYTMERKEETKDLTYHSAKIEKGKTPYMGNGTLSGQLSLRYQEPPLGLPKSLEHLHRYLYNGEADSSVFLAYGGLRYKSPSGMSVDCTYREALLSVTWGKDVHCWRGVPEASEARFIFDSSKWEILALFPRPKTGSRNLHLKVFDRTINIPDRYAGGTSQ